MAGPPSPTVTAYLGLAASGGNFFTLDDPVRGVLDNGTYTLAGDLGTDLTGYAFDIQIFRGRVSELEQTGPGTATVVCRNHTRALDPLNTSGAFFGSLRIGRRADISIYGQTIYSGVIDDWQIEYDVDGGTSVRLPMIDGLGQLGRREFDAWTATAGQTAGPRITSILNRAEVGWPGGARDIGTGVSTLQGDAVSWGSNVLNYCQLVALSDLGHFYADRRNVVTYKDRTSLVNPTSTLTFKDDDTGVRFHGARLASGAERFYSRVGIDREGGLLQTATDTSAGTEDGIRALSRSGLLMDSDEQARGMADWLLTLYKTPTVRIDGITVNVSALPDAQQPVVSSLDLNSVVSVVWTPLGVGSQISTQMSVEGIAHSIPVGGPHIMGLSLAPISQAFVFTLDDPVYGALDGVGVLGF